MQIIRTKHHRRIDPFGRLFRIEYLPSPHRIGTRIYYRPRLAITIGRSFITLP